MKPTFQHLGFDDVEGSFLCYEVQSEKFGFHWHYHPECEISFVKQGYGTRLVGDHVAPFTEGDLLMLGSDLPHTLISDELFNKSGKKMEVVVIQFAPAIFESRSLEIEELSGIGRLLKGALRGLFFSPEGNAAGQYETTVSLLKTMPMQKGFERYLSLLKVLNGLAELSGVKLASEYYSPNKSVESEARIGKVCSFIHDHFSSEITIAKLADLAHMNEAAFCRFFKKMTGKTAINYINDLRIGKACQLLQGEGQSVGEIAYQSGFNSIPYFNRYFQKSKQCSPTQFRDRYHDVATT